jgi:hypothetical protein
MRKESEMLLCVMERENRLESLSCAFLLALAVAARIKQVR